MDCEILFNLRNSYYLGKHTQTLDLWREYLAEGDSLTEVQSKEVGLIMQKSLLMMLKTYSESVTTRIFLFGFTHGILDGMFWRRELVFVY